MKNAILIKTQDSYPLVIPVNNFSKENVTGALSKALGIVPEKFEQLVANTMSGIYAATEYNGYAYNLLPTEQPISDVRYKKTFTVEYVEIFETKTN